MADSAAAVCCALVRPRSLCSLRYRCVSTLKEYKKSSISTDELEGHVVVFAGPVSSPLAVCQSVAVEGVESQGEAPWF